MCLFLHLQHGEHPQTCRLAIAKTLQHTATHLQHTCNTLQHTCTTMHTPATPCSTLQHSATHCSTLQHTAVHCSTLQHTAAHCNTLQHTCNMESIHELAGWRSRRESTSATQDTTTWYTQSCSTPLSRAWAESGGQDDVYSSSNCVAV